MQTVTSVFKFSDVIHSEPLKVDWVSQQSISRLMPWGFTDPSLEIYERKSTASTEMEATSYTQDNDHGYEHDNSISNLIPIDPAARSLPISVDDFATWFSSLIQTTSEPYVNTLDITAHDNTSIDHTLAGGMIANISAELGLEEAKDMEFVEEENERTVLGISQGVQHLVLCAA